MKLVVTRHPALVEYLREAGIVGDNVEVVAQVTPEQVRGRHVVGVLPLHLAAEADRVTVVPLAVPPELRGQELSLEQVRELAGEPRTFIVSDVTPASKESVIEWSDRLGHRSRESWCILRDTSGRLHKFRGESIPGVCRAVPIESEKNGKWSYTIYRIRLATGAACVYSGHSGWETGTLAEALGVTTWAEASKHLGVERAEAERFFRARAKGTARLLDEAEAPI